MNLCCNTAKVEWHKIVWFSNCIPRHAFVLWMAMQNRLSTQDRIAIWKPNDVMQCAFCKQCLDSIEHLFFTCVFSIDVWKEMQKMLSVNMSFSWRSVVEELYRLPNNNNIWSIVRRLVFGVVVYFLWLKITGFEVKESKTVKEVEDKRNVEIQRRKSRIVSNSLVV
ncbi:reverse transcriptase zinc-binding domain-containing protein [Tanacetum coccineum]|uniref:Reverse transcriptase zinc-binding domain-containing protein n=1 Tax=Tanacetum coccineum TaxID=301880 RepID=A0ABQ5J650_9ASTR